MKIMQLRDNRKFSIIEMMTVVFIILLLMSLLVPTFYNIKKNSRSAICKGQLRQIGVMLTSYSSENGGYLPNDNRSDIVQTVSSNNQLYYGWNGHLLPYLNSGLDAFDKRSRVAVNNGKVYVDTGGGWWYVKNSSKEAINPVTKNDGGWNVVHKAMQEGGFNDLKVFICPEVHSNTFDVSVSNDFNGLKLPRIMQMSNAFFGAPGVPTSYLANDLWFGFDGEYKPNASSLRLDQINNISKKSFLVEGGMAYAKGSNGIIELAYYNEGSLKTPWDGLKKTNTGGHLLNFVHDSIEQFWIMNSEPYVYAFPAWNVSGVELANKFNIAFSGKAQMIAASYGKYSIISYIDPAEKPFEKFFKDNPPGLALANFLTFDEPEFHYMTGNMNVLFGDGSVITKDQAWLSLNSAQVAGHSQD
jgi:type II secretory pathway pseudopilin PulG